MASIAEKSFTLKNQKMITLRSPKVFDVDEILKYRKLISVESTNTYHYPEMPLDRQKEIDLLTSIEQNPKALLIAAFYEGKVIGMLGITPVRDNHPWLTHLGYFGIGIIKDFWSSGLASILLKEMNLQVKDMGYEKLEATVKVSNEAALQLYLEDGFQIEGRRRLSSCIQGKYEDEYFIAKYLKQKPWRPPVLETSRLILRPIHISDAAALYDYCQDPQVSVHTLWNAHSDILQTKKWIREYIYQCYNAEEFEPLGICLKEKPSTVIGTIGCTSRNSAKNLREMGFALNPKYWNQGIITEAGNALIDYLFKHTDTYKIYATHKTPNIISGKALVKMGMTYEATLKSHMYSKEIFWDIKYYSIINPRGLA